MKNYVVKVKALCERTLKIYAPSENEAIEFSAKILLDTNAIHFNKDDISELDCTVDSGFNWNNNRYKGCKTCIHACPECGSCILEDDNECGDLKCEDCEFSCPECGACCCDSDSDNDVFCDACDDEYELRKQIFSDYLSNTFKEMIEYADTLFGLES